MKIRIKGNSIRLRLTKPEVETFATSGRYEERTQIGQNTLVYVLQAKAGISQLEANFEQNTVTIFFPSDEKELWANSNRVGYSNNEAWNDPETLSLLVEKDFTCLDNTVEDQSDNYPNPKLQ